jgi:hypothetical protein
LGKDLICDKAYCGWQVILDQCEKHTQPQVSPILFTEMTLDCHFPFMLYDL